MSSRARAVEADGSFVTLAAELTRPRRSAHAVCRRQNLEQVRQGPASGVGENDVVGFE